MFAKRRVERAKGKKKICDRTKKRGGKSRRASRGFFFFGVWGGCANSKKKGSKKTKFPSTEGAVMNTYAKGFFRAGGVSG